mgnify:CR=1 FL=1
MQLLLPLSALVLATAVSSTVAQDANRGAQLYLRLTGGVQSCVSCHGPDPTQGRNNILRAADNPAALQKALNTVGVMGYLKAALGEGDVADLSAYLGRVAVMSSATAPLAVWPPTLDFGTLSLGWASPVHRVLIENRSPSSLTLPSMRITAGPFTLQTDCPALIAPGGRCEARVRAEPIVTGTSTGALLGAPDSGGASFLLGLVVEARTEGVAALAAQRLDERLAFAATPVGSSQTLTWTLVSTGTQPFTLASPNLSGPQAGEFALGGDCTPGRTLPVAATCTLQVSHRPSGVLPSRAMLQLRGGGTHPAPLEITGQAVAAEAVEEPSLPATASDSGGGGAGLSWLALLSVAILRLRRTTRERH